MGLALLDTSIVIAVLNRHDTLHPAARRSLLAARDRHALAISALTYAEILVGPLRAGEDAARSSSASPHRPTSWTSHRRSRDSPRSCGRGATSSSPTR